MRDPPARHDGRWLMTPLDLRRGKIRTTTIMTTPRTNGSPRLFLPPSWYRVVSHGVSGLQDEILSTDHDVSRHSLAYLSLSLSLYHSASALGTIASGWSSPFPLSSLTSPSRPLARERSHLFQTTMLDGRLRLIRQRRTREKPIGAIKGIGSRRCKDRSFPPLYTTIYFVDV